MTAPNLVAIHYPEPFAERFPSITHSLNASITYMGGNRYHVKFPSREVWELTARDIVAARKQAHQLWKLIRQGSL